jgi:hypothetical protein
MAGITYNVSEIMLGGGIIYRAPIGSTIPLKTVAIGGVWPAGWDIVGLTSSPTVLGHTFDAVVADKIQQANGPVRRGRTNEAARLETTLAQVANLKSLELAYNGGTFAATAAAVGMPGYEEFNAGGEPYEQPYMWGWEGITHNDDTGVEFPIRGFLYRANVDGGNTFEFGKGQFSDGVPLMVGGLIDMNRVAKNQLFYMYRITAPALP